MTNLVYSSYRGSQLGVTVRDESLNQLSFFNIGAVINDIAAVAGDELFLVSENNICHYRADGTLINKFTWPSSGILYDSVTVVGDRIYCGYSGSQTGFTCRDMNLNQLFHRDTDFVINGIATGPNNDLFMVSGNTIYHYSDNGDFLNKFSWPNNSINYSDVTVMGNFVIASYNGSQTGFTVRNLSLEQLMAVPTDFNPSSVGSGRNNDIYLTSENRIFRYAMMPQFVEEMTFPDSSITYDGITGTKNVVVAEPVA